jgi:type II secretory ATPase GspE/PulE/Tfp pilus assembly ATPase PilB-like protein
MWLVLTVAWVLAVVWLIRDSLRVFGWSAPWIPRVSTILIASGLITMSLRLAPAVTAAVALPFGLIAYASARRQRMPGNRRLFDSDAALRLLFKAGDRVGLGDRLRSRFGPVLLRTVEASGRPVSSLGLHEIGLDERVLRELRGILERPNGLLVISGPEHSGKTTTAYAALRELDFATRRIVTVENHVEQILPGARQREANTAAGITLAHVLETALRLDPDVLFIGDLADTSTAKIAVRESLAGRLVITTLRARDSTDTLERLLSLGLAPQAVQTALIAVFSQRLLRLLCDRCKVPTRPSAALRARLRIPAGAPETLYEALPAGCEACNHSGYGSVVPLGELLMMAGRLREALHRRLRIAALRDVAREERTRSIGTMAVTRALRGETSLAEARRATR